jgi:hypothetical protein
MMNDEVNEGCRWRFYLLTVSNWSNPIFFGPYRLCGYFKNGKYEIFTFPRLLRFRGFQHQLCLLTIINTDIIPDRGK